MKRVEAGIRVIVGNQSVEAGIQVIVVLQSILRSNKSDCQSKPYLRSLQKRDNTYRYVHQTVVDFPSDRNLIEIQPLP
jgi:hypothetical protein